MYGYNAEPPIAIPIYTVLPYCVIRLLDSPLTPNSAYGAAGHLKLAGIKSRLKKALQGVTLAEQLLKTNQGVTYRAKVLIPVFRIAHAQSGKKLH